MLLLSECETEADLHDIVYAIDLLTQAGKTVDAYCYCFKPSTDAPPHSAVRLLNRQDTDLTMRPKVAILKPFSRKHYDAVIDLTAGLCLPLRYLSLYANTSLRCGKDWGNFRIDIQNRQASPDNASEPLSDRRYLLQQIIHYLQQFK
ncbi:MAG: hypothetical protein LBS16_04360 [Prevotellaceae bacterium]|nr:hypothetical protein [Prevotellaceae bacterium]